MNPLEPRAYVPGQVASLDKLIKTYEGLATNPSVKPVDAEERTTEDPLGLKGPPPAQGLEASLEATRRLVKFSRLVAGEYGLPPESVLFMVELFSLIYLNATDIPLTSEQIEKTRKAAADYYKAHADGLG